MRNPLTPQDVTDLVGSLIRGRPAQQDQTLYLLIVDCETFRFTLEGPMEPERVALWEGEATRALAAGRSICCIPIAGAEPNEILVLAAELGCDSWPPNTIIAPLDTVETPLYLKKSQTAGRDGAERKR
jgi:hypothetical protein